MQDAPVISDPLAALVEPNVIEDDIRDDIDMAVVQPEGMTVQQQDSDMHAASMFGKPLCGDMCCHNVAMHGMLCCGLVVYVASVAGIY